MRIWSFMLVLLFVVVGTATLAQQGEVEERKAASQQAKKGKVGKLELDKIVFAGHGKAKKDDAKLSEENQESEEEISEAPQPLTKEEHSAAIDRIKELASQREIQTRAYLVFKPIYIQAVVTPRTPYVNWGNIDLDWGAFKPRSKYAKTGKKEYRRYPETFDLNLVGLTPGSYYMLDIAVNSLTWRLTGLFSGTVYPSNGHLIVGFIAANSTATLYFRPDTGSSGVFYRATLTRLN